jgi:ABC-type methionine transport system permease subunit
MKRFLVHTLWFFVFMVLVATIAGLIVAVFVPREKHDAIAEFSALPIIIISLVMTVLRSFGEKSAGAKKGK